MRLWNWFKKDEPVAAKEPEVDDWESKYGDWHETEVCHCGQRRCYIDYYGHHYHDVCPKCGHKDKWSKYVRREEWEQSPSRMAKNWDSSKWRRNERYIEWTLHHCTIKDEE